MTLVSLLYIFCIILKLQNHRIFEIGRDPCRSPSPGHLLKAGWVTAGCAGPCPVSFWVSPRMETPNLSRQPVLVFDHLHSKSVFLCLNHVFHLAHCFLSTHRTSLRRLWLHLLYSISSIDSHWHIDNLINQLPWALSSPGLRSIQLSCRRPWNRFCRQ